MVDRVQLRTRGRLFALPLNLSFESVNSKRKNKKTKVLRSAQPRNLLDPFANMCEQDADDPVKYRGFHPVYSPGRKVAAQPEPPLIFL